MSRHAFRLASVLSFREAQLTEKASQVSSIENDIQSLEKARDQVDSAQLAIQENVVTPRAVTAADLRDATDYLDVLERERARLREQVNLARQSLGEARSALVERHQAVSILRRLRERLVEAAVVESGRTEQRALDELSGANHYRRQSA